MVTGRTATVFAKVCAAFDSGLARRYARWYQDFTIRYPNWFSPIGWQKTIRLSDGTLFEARFHEVIGRNLILKEVFEPEITERIKQTLRPGDVFVDVGANIGYYTLQASQAVGFGGLVLAFEPSPSNLGVLGRHVALNACENVLIFSEALSDHDGVARLSLPLYFNPGVCSLGVGPSADGTFHEGFTVTSTRRFDKVWQSLQLNRSVKLIKIDAEGHELHVIRGMEQLLQSTTDLQIVCELSPESYSLGEFIRHMQKLGFSAECLRDGFWIPATADSPPVTLCYCWFRRA